MEEDKMKNIKININDYLQTKETTFITLSGSRYAEIEDAIIETTNEKWKSKIKEKIEEIFEILDKIPQVIIELNGNVMTVKHDIAEILQELLEGDK